MGLWDKLGVHKGSWGTPEFGLTEAIASVVSPTTAHASEDEGSQMFVDEVRTSPQVSQTMQDVKGASDQRGDTGGGGGGTSGGTSGGGGGTTTGGGGGGVGDDIVQAGKESARAAEEALRAAAEANWRKTAGKLRGQKREMGTLKKEKLRAAKQRKKKGLKSYKKKRKEQKEEYEEQEKETKSTIKEEKAKLSRNFRDMSIKAAEAMRATGVQLSSYAMGRQGDIEETYQRGYKELAKEGVEAVSKLNEAIEKTNEYYNNKRDELKNWYGNKEQATLDWYNDQISKINEQLAYNDFAKTQAIKEAESKAADILYDAKSTAAQMRDKWDRWLLQKKMEIDSATAKAAAGKADEAAMDLDKVLEISDVTSKGIQRQAPDVGITPEKQAKIEENFGIYIPTREEAEEAVRQNRLEPWQRGATSGGGGGGGGLWSAIGL